MTTEPTPGLRTAAQAVVEHRAGEHGVVAYSCGVRFDDHIDALAGLLAATPSEPDGAQGEGRLGEVKRWLVMSGMPDNSATDETARKIANRTPVDPADQPIFSVRDMQEHTSRIASAARRVPPDSTDPLTVDGWLRQAAQRMADEVGAVVAGKPLPESYLAAYENLRRALAALRSVSADSTAGLDPVALQNARAALLAHLVDEVHHYRGRMTKVTTGDWRTILAVIESERDAPHHTRAALSASPAEETPR